MQRVYYSPTAYFVSTHAEHVRKLKQDAKERLKQRFGMKSMAKQVMKPKQKIIQLCKTLLWSILVLYYGFVLLAVSFS